MLKNLALMHVLSPLDPPSRSTDVIDPDTPTVNLTFTLPASLGLFRNAAG